MIRRPAAWILLALLGAAAPAAAQTLVRPAQPSSTGLTLSEAVAKARAHNPDATVAAAAERASVQRVAQARAGYLPRVDAMETWQRGNQPVFAFGSLLAQRLFSQNNFAIEALNHPDAVGNFRLGLQVEQPLFDPSTPVQIRTAGVARDMAMAGRALVGQELAVAVAGAYGQVLMAAAHRSSAAAAVASAEADRERAANRRDAGLVTDADVLQMDVHLAATRARQIRAEADESVARAQLNALMGEPLDAVFELELTPATVAAEHDATALEAEALRSRPEVRLASLREQLAASAVSGARAAFLPQVSAQAGWESNGGAWAPRSPSWAVGVSARINLFRGFADQARLAEAKVGVEQQAAERQKAETAAKLEVRIVTARLAAARAAEVVGRQAAAQAREQQRIVRDRYEQGLSDATSLLRAAEAVMAADAQQTSAQVEVLVTSAAFTRALGRP